MPTYEETPLTIKAFQQHIRDRYFDTDNARGAAVIVVQRVVGFRVAQFWRGDTGRMSGDSCEPVATFMEMATRGVPALAFENATKLAGNKSNSLGWVL